MHIIKLCRIGNSLTVTLPESVVEALHLRENDDITIEVIRDRAVLTRATPDFQDAWAAYQKIEPRYRDANHRLAACSDCGDSGA